MSELAEPLATSYALRGIRAKLRRAKHHLEAIDELLDGLGDDDRYEITIEQHHDRLADLVMKGHQPFGVDLGVLIGDFLHNARGALDHLVSILLAQQIDAGAVTGDDAIKWPTTCQFPICDSSDLFGRAHYRIRGLSDGSKTTIERLQPYRRIDTYPLIDNPLRLLREFSDADKHRIITPTYAAIASLEVIVTPPTPHFYVVNTGPLKYNTVACRAYLTGVPLMPLTGAPVHVQVRFKGGIGIALLDDVRVVGGVRDALHAVNDEVNFAASELAQTFASGAEHSAI